MSITRLITRVRIYSAAIVSVVVSVAVVGQAAAEVWPDGRDGAKLSIQMSVPKTHVLAPDDVTRVLPKRSISAPVPDFVDRYIRSHGTQVVQTTRPAASQSADGFDWGAAGIGASTTAALLFTLGLGVGMARRSRTRSAVA
jgi:hypothetical protein